MRTMNEGIPPSTSPQSEDKRNTFNFPTAATDAEDSEPQMCVYFRKKVQDEVKNYVLLWKKHAEQSRKLNLSLPHKMLKRSRDNYDFGLSVHLKVLENS